MWFKNLLSSLFGLRPKSKPTIENRTDQKKFKEFSPHEQVFAFCPLCGHGNKIKDTYNSVLCNNCGEYIVNPYLEEMLDIKKEKSFPKNCSKNKEKIKNRESLIFLCKNEALLNFVKKCAELEDSYREKCYIHPSPAHFDAFFYKAAVEARKSKEYELEIAICKRLIDIRKEYDIICKEDGVTWFKFGAKSTPHENICKRLPRALELLKKQKENIKIKKQEKSTKKRREIKQKPNSILEKQCAELNIPLEYVDIMWDTDEKKYVISNRERYKRPEDAVMELMRKAGWQGTAYEFRPYILAMKAACFEYVEEVGKARFMEDYFVREFNLQTYLYPLDKSRAMDMARAKPLNETLELCNFFLDFKENRKSFPLLKIKDIEAVITGIGISNFYILMEYVFDKPHDNANGWPDIFAYNGKDVSLIEVKTTDHMRDSQIYTWTNLIKEFGFNAKVVCVRKMV